MIVIVGCGAAGLSAFRTLRELKVDEEVKIISAEKPYSKPLLPYYLSGEIRREDLFLNDVEVLVERVISVKPRENLILTKKGEVEYDKLLIAIGARSVRPRIEGLESEGVFSFNTLSDADGIVEYLKNNNVKRVVVVGGGFVGISAAIALRKRGFEVTVVEIRDRILPEAFDKDFAEIAKGILEENGVEVLLGKKVSRIVGKRVEGVEVDGEFMRCEMVIISVGVQPNLEIVKDSGIKTNVGIIVNEKMQTNFKNVYAAGDCAETPDLITGETTINALWINASIQGRIAAYNIAGIERLYNGSFRMNVIDIFGIPFVSIGYTTDEFEDFENKRIYYRDGRVVGFQAFGFEEISGTLNIVLGRKEIPKLFHFKSIFRL